MNSNPVKLSRSNILDLLRFIAVIIVVLGHFTDAFNRVYNIVPENLKLNQVFRYGHISLCILFIISGYVVTMTSVNKSIKEFFITRFSRIYPIFWVSCIVGFILSRIPFVPTYLDDISFKRFISNMTLVPFLFGYDYSNPVFWTLILELFFYTFIGIVIIFKLWKYILPILLGFLILCIFTNTDGVPGILPRFTPYFIAGMIFYFIHIQYDAKWKLYSLLAVCLGTCLQGMSYLAKEMRPSYSEPHAYHTSIIWGLVIITFAGFLYIIIKNIDIPNRPVYQILGNMSFTVYLFHIYWLAPYWYLRNLVQPQLLLAGLIISIIFASWIINVWIEKPFGKYIKNILTHILSSRYLQLKKKPV